MQQSNDSCGSGGCSIRPSGMHVVSIMLFKLHHREGGVHLGDTAAGCCTFFSPRHKPSHQTAERGENSTRKPSHAEAHTPMREDPLRVRIDNDTQQQ